MKLNKRRFFTLVGCLILIIIWLSPAAKLSTPISSPSLIQTANSCACYCNGVPGVNPPAGCRGNTCSNCPGNNCSGSCGGGGGGGGGWGTGSLNLTVSQTPLNVGDSATVDLFGQCGRCSNNVHIDPGGGFTGNQCGDSNRRLASGCNNWHWLENCTATYPGDYTAHGWSDCGDRYYSYHINTPPPPGPGPFNVYSGGSSCPNNNPHININWDASANVNSTYDGAYEIYRNNTYLATVNYNTTSFTDNFSPSSSGSWFYYTIQAVNDGGVRWSNNDSGWIQVAACDTTPPNAFITGFPAPGIPCYTSKSTDPNYLGNYPVKVNASDPDNATNTLSVSLRLTDSSGNVLRDNISTSLNSGLFQTTVNPSGLPAGKGYKFLVKAVDPYNNTRGYYNPSSPFDLDTCIRPYLNVNGGGDVHSNTQVNTPGGP